MRWNTVHYSIFHFGEKYFTSNQTGLKTEITILSLSMWPHDRIDSGSHMHVGVHYTVLIMKWQLISFALFVHIFSVSSITLRLNNKCDKGSPCFKPLDALDHSFWLPIHHHRITKNSVNQFLCLSLIIWSEKDS